MLEHLAAGIRQLAGDAARDKTGIVTADLVKEGFGGETPDGQTRAEQRTRPQAFIETARAYTDNSGDRPQVQGQAS